MTTVDQPTYTPTVGDIVTIDLPRAAGETFKVTRLLPKNVEVVNQRTGRKAKASPQLLALANPVPGIPSVGVPYVPRKIIDVGMTVRLHNKPGIYVVTKMNARGYSVALLGGEDGRYWNASDSALIPTPITWEIER